ncbi:MAG: UDP-3-O-(3-hydroxymyristoyl)glucosamine N-acyltransferase [Planctomycetaceae bacterium]|nr:UDP-3-O-(3-hydroxymyristoyl)glucosamine N-acyltransferase [Planctomycetaceae bacterium]
MPKTLTELAALLHGLLVGDGGVIVGGVSPIHNAEPTDITFLENPEKVALLEKSNACAVIVSKSMETFPESRRPRIPYIMVEQVLPSFETAARLFLPEPVVLARTVSPDATVAASVRMGKNVSIGPHCVVGENVEIGDDCTIYGGVHLFEHCRVGEGTTIYPNAVLYENTVVGKNCIIHSNVVLGAFGFGYDSSKGIHKLSSQMGNVVLGDFVEIGACSTIDRGTYGSTKIGEGTKIDNLVMIAHNCKIGKHNLICAHTGIAGSTTTGDYVVMAGRVGVRDHVHIGNRAVLGAMAGIMGDVPEDARWVGIPATPEKEQMKKLVAFAKLPDMRKELKQLQQQVAELERQVGVKSEGAT